MIDSYPKITEKLFNINYHGAIKSGLDNISKLNRIFGNPDRKFQSVHVAGTNGKGSVTVKIGKCLELSGYRVGIFTSPHITSFCERIRINEEYISENDVVKYLTEIFDIIEKHQIPATFYEITTMLALKYFADQKVDWAVFETGLGGRFDATNILQPKLSVITSISLDHTEILGNTLEKIAHEKAGIIKKDIPVVLGPRTPFVPRINPYHEVNGVFESTELENREVAKKAIEVLGVNFIEEGLDAELPCRMEKIDMEGVEVILDVAHNPDGLLQLFKTLKGKPVRIVFGMSKTKDLSACAELIKKNINNIYLIEVPEGRGYSFETLIEAFHPMDVNLFPTIKEAIIQALKHAQKGGETVLICGSCYMMSEAKKALNI